MATVANGRFCDGAPAPSVVRARVRVGDKPGKVNVQIEQIYGAAAAPETSRIAARFADLPDDETLLVPLGKDGNVLGTAFPVFREKVSLDLGVPDMSEAEAAALLLSTRCEEGLRALRTQGVRPSPVVGQRGCGSCHVASTAPFDVGSFAIVVGAVIVMSQLARRYS
jgi:hypothetical protein